ncbi:PREDICTED: ADP-ribosylation factor-like protein 10 isoform X1 [Chinchilla lanigera]|uniref:ADP-ribosylation factor-like protein 10 isoform X1 n=1 Tax=Chinchilla lanigera TaxID=34839 RepID=UPI000698A329|nr:PREDICTED: ADP-ribosylation factor-like protein 10 isoform X1 [Chinchilla lanigera]
MVRAAPAQCALWRSPGGWREKPAASRQIPGARLLLRSREVVITVRERTGRAREHSRKIGFAIHNSRSSAGPTPPDLPRLSLDRAGRDVGKVKWEVAGRSLTSVPQPEVEEAEEPALEELEQREVLVLGLDGCGKSTFLRVLSGKTPLEGHVPTWGFNSVRLPTRDFEVDLLEIGGSQNLRFYWKEFVNEVDVLVFMVDSADRLRLPWARQELHKLLDKDPDLPVVVVANKQDLNEAMSVVELQQELGLQAVDSQREIFLLAASIAPAGSGIEEPGTVHIWKLLLELLS